MADDLQSHDEPAHLARTLALLRCAFPNGVDEQAYLPLLAVLGKEMSMRNLADAMAEFTGKQWPYVYNDVLTALSPAGEPSSTEQDTVRQRLRPCGYDEWLRTDE